MRFVAKEQCTSAPTPYPAAPASTHVASAPASPRARSAVHARTACGCGPTPIPFTPDPREFHAYPRAIQVRQVIKEGAIHGDTRPTHRATVGPPLIARAPCLPRLPRNRHIRATDGAVWGRPWNHGGGGTCGLCWRSGGAPCSGQRAWQDAGAGGLSTGLHHQVASSSLKPLPPISLLASPQLPNRPDRLLVA